MVKWTRIFFLAILLPFSLSLIACQAVVYEKGTVLNPQNVARIKAGETTRAQVKDLLGVPTIVNSLRKDRWIYVQDRQFKNIQRTFARVINRVEITFDERGVVKNIQHNFDQELLDPQSLPEAHNAKSWFAWLWDGAYARPATGGQPADSVTPAASTTNPSSGAQGATENRPGTNPWWRFWSSGKE